MAKKKKTSRGRPKGSKNRVYLDAKAVSVPASCPKCGSTEMNRLPGRAIKRPIAGILPTGHQYHEVTWTRHKCTKCSQLIMVRSFIGEEEKIQAGIDAPGETPLDSLQS